MGGVRLVHGRSSPGLPRRVHACWVSPRCGPFSGRVRASGKRTVASLFTLMGALWLGFAAQRRLRPPPHRARRLLPLACLLGAGRSGSCERNVFDRCAHPDMRRWRAVGRCRRRRCRTRGIERLCRLVAELSWHGRDQTPAHARLNPPAPGDLARRKPLADPV